MKEPPADILRRLRPIPTDRRPGPAFDIDGVDPSGTPLSVEVLGATAPVLVLFLSAACIGCRDLWQGLPAFQASLADVCRLAVVTRSPGDEDVAAVVTLAAAVTLSAAATLSAEATGAPSSDPGARARLPVVMSTTAYSDYRVDGPPFYAVVGPGGVLGEGVAWGVEATVRAVRAALVAAR